MLERRKFILGGIASLAFGKNAEAKTKSVEKITDEETFWREVNKSNTVVIDARNEGDPSFNMNRFRGRLRKLPLSDFQTDMFNEDALKIAKGKNVIVVCTVGVNSRKFAERLLGLNFPSVRSIKTLEGGLRSLKKLDQK